MDSRVKLNNGLWRCALCLAIFVGTLNSARADSAPATNRIGVLRFDATIELNAPLCRTHVVLFVRYWVSPELYRVAVVWAEPHASSLNYPIYPPALNVASDLDSFTIKHQFKHTFDGAFSKPFGERGPFVHRFNSYNFSDIRFEEEEALDLRLYTRDIEHPKSTSAPNDKGVVEISIPRPSGGSKKDLRRVGVRATEGHLDELRLLDDAGDLLKSIQYEYAQQGEGGQLRTESVLLAERPITVGFTGKKTNYNNRR